MLHIGGLWKGLDLKSVLISLRAAARDGRGSTDQVVITVRVNERCLRSRRTEFVWGRLCICVGGAPYQGGAGWFGQRSENDDERL